MQFALLLWLLLSVDPKATLGLSLKELGGSTRMPNTTGKESTGRVNAFSIQQRFLLDYIV